MLHAAPPTDPTTVEISHSQVETFLQCQRKWFYKKVLKLPTDDDSSSRAYGAAGHEGLAVIFRNGGLEQAQVVARSALSKASRQWEDAKQANYQQHLAKHLEAFYEKVYLGKWSLDWSTVSTEEYWDIAPTPGILWRGYIDLVTRNRDGRIAIFDHKFSSKMYADNLSRSLGNSHQLANYTMAYVRKTGQWPQEVGYILFLKKKSFSEKPVYAEGDVKVVSIPVTPQFAQFAMSVEQMDVQIAEAMRACYIAYWQHGPQAAWKALANYGSCHDYGSQCPFYMGCSTGNPIHNHVRIT